MIIYETINGKNMFICMVKEAVFKMHENKLDPYRIRNDHINLSNYFGGDR